MIISLAWDQMMVGGGNTLPMMISLAWKPMVLPRNEITHPELPTTGSKNIVVKILCNNVWLINSEQMRILWTIWSPN